ncbi:MAG: transporter [Porticoccus sp.]
MTLSKATFIVYSLMLTALPALADHPSLGINSGYGGAIVGQSATTLPEGAFSFSLKQEYIENNTFSDRKLSEFGEAGQDVHSVESLDVINLNTAWGFSEKLTLGLSLPVISRNNISQAPHHHEEEEEEEHHEEDAPSVDALGDSSGIGDLTAYGQYQFFTSADNRRLAAIYFGVKLPTGKTDQKTDQGETFEAEHQPGSGSVDGLLGLSYSQRLNRWSLDSSILASLATEGTQDTDLGNALNYDLALSYPLMAAEESHNHHDHHHSPSLTSAATIVFELNGEWRDKVDVDGTTQAHTGGNLVYLTAGVRVNFGRQWSATLSGGIPVVENLNGQQSDPNWRGGLVLSRSF